jgi:predicted nucleic acid-binding protein
VLARSGASAYRFAECKPSAPASGQIAAIAATEELTVVTENTFAFEPFAELSERVGPGAGIRL